MAGTDLCSSGWHNILPSFQELQLYEDAGIVGVFKLSVDRVSDHA